MGDFYYITIYRAIFQIPFTYISTFLYNKLKIKKLILISGIGFVLFYWLASMTKNSSLFIFYVSLPYCFSSGFCTSYMSGIIYQHFHKYKDIIYSIAEQANTFSFWFTYILFLIANPNNALANQIEVHGKY